MTTSTNTLAAESRPSLDLPGVLPLVLVAATWEFLLNRVVGLASGNVQGGELATFLGTLTFVGAYIENFTLILSLVLLAQAVLAMMRRSAFGPIPHRVTISGFALTLLTVATANALFPVGPDTALLAQAAGVLLSALIIFGLSWHRVSRRLLIGAVLLLLPTLLRFYSSCAISIPLLRTSGAIPLHAFRAAEVAALLIALLAPWLMAGLSPRELIRRPPLVAMGLASMPMLALAAALLSHGPQVQELCLLSLGFELIVSPALIVYPLAIFSYLLAVSMLVLPGVGRLRSHAEQRVGYGMAFLFLAGLDGLRGAVRGLGADSGDIPELVRYLLEGHWDHINPDHQALVGPPLRDIFQLVLMGLGFVLIARGVSGQARPEEAPAQEGTP